MSQLMEYIWSLLKSHYRTYDGLAQRFHSVPYGQGR